MDFLVHQDVHQLVKPIAEALVEIIVKPIVIITVLLIQHQVLAEEVENCHVILAV